MKKLLGLILIATTLCSCSNEKSFSGKLDIPGTIFEYSAIGKGIPCIAFTGAENIDKNLYPEEFLEHINLIHASPDKLPENIIHDLTLEDVINDIEKARKHLGLNKIAIMGHSMFGTLPLDYALMYPDNVLFTISTGSVPAFNKKYNEAVSSYWENFATDERKEIFRSRIDSLKATNFDSLETGEQLIRRYIASAPKYFYNPRFDCNDLWNDVSINMSFFNRYFGEILAKTDNSEKYKIIKAPNLIISGKYDFICPHYLWEGTVEEIPNAKYVLFENTGHNPMLEIPDEFSQTVIKWIDSL